MLIKPGGWKRKCGFMPQRAVEVSKFHQRVLHFKTKSLLSFASNLSSYKQLKKTLIHSSEY